MQCLCITNAVKMQCQCIANSMPMHCLCNANAVPMQCRCRVHAVFNDVPTVVCISLETSSVAKQVSVVVGWVKINISLMAQLKGLTANFKLM